MFHKVCALMIIVMMLSGFSWGRKESKKKEVPQAVSQEAPKEETAQETEWGYNYWEDTPENAEEKPEAEEVKESDEALASRPAAEVNPAADEIPAKMIKALASGTDEQRRARVESLRRLSAALQSLNKKRGAGE